VFQEHDPDLCEPVRSEDREERAYTGLTTYERSKSWPTPTRRPMDLVKLAKIAISPVLGKGLAELEVAFTNP
jgi:hypothetical protein